MTLFLFVTSHNSNYLLHIFFLKDEIVALYLLIGYTRVIVFHLTIPSED